MSSTGAYASEEASPLVLGTRGSRLALWQARRVKEQLEAGGHAARLREITTTGDRRQDAPLSELNDEAVFTKELDRALLDGGIHLAVHSLKDLPSHVPEGITLAAVSARASPLDAFVAHPSFEGKLKDLPEEATLATASLRRRAQLKAWRPDLEVAPVRGNVDTRLQKLAHSDWHGMVLAVAGLRRMGLAEHIREKIAPRVMVPAVGQGALGIACASENDALRSALRRTLHDERAGTCAAAERAFMKAVGGGCQVPTGAYARFPGNGDARSGRLLLSGCIAGLDGEPLLREERTTRPEDAEATGRALAEALLEQGGREVLNEIRPYE
jgi:hydroxymethylbilane synthase